MKNFYCQSCLHILFFENTVCEKCSVDIGYISEQNALSAIVPSKHGHWTALAKAGDSSSTFKHCANFKHGVCNWLIPETSKSKYCAACELNRYIPNTSSTDLKEEWRQLEFAKHRLVYSLLRLNLPLISKNEDSDNGLSFDFITEKNKVPHDAATMTGHAEGQVTINTEEANPVQREQMRTDMDEPYRTLIGHFRHEVGHYYWDQLIAPFDDKLDAFRDLFGDENLDYQLALKNHYAKPENEDWKQAFVSDYASSHPWEDWAESWAHYFHIIDSLETAYAFGLSLAPRQDKSGSMTMKADIDPYSHDNFDDILQRALAMSVAVNSINRSMGQPDLYPFVVTAPVKKKLHFIHNAIKDYQ